MHTVSDRQPVSSPETPDAERAPRQLGVSVFCSAALCLHLALVIYMVFLPGGMGTMLFLSGAFLLTSLVHVVGVAVCLLFRSALSPNQQHRTVMLVGSVCLAAGVWAAAFLLAPHFRAQCRVRWKDRAIVEIGRLADDQSWIAAHTESTKAGKGHANPKFCYTEWLSERMILMANGEWLVYESHCSKTDWRIDDIFIARGSDGRWYYSTCHFCVGMSVLVMGQSKQPSDLDTFARNWRLEEFDGKSDDCLRKTQMSPDWEGLDEAESARRD